MRRRASTMSDQRGIIPPPGGPRVQAMRSQSVLDHRPVIHVLGLLACCVAVLLCVPALIDLAYGNPDWQRFILAAAISGFLGVTAALATRIPGRLHLDLRQGFLVTTLGWVTVGVLGALPFYELGNSPADAFFESVSGITTTGSTILAGLDQLPPGILLWRALLQWLGGIGIIAVAILMLPLLRIGGMQLFRIESAATAEERASSAINTIAGVLAVYASLTLLCGMVYLALGMTAFDATVHAMTTLSTGGYSSHDLSFAYFESLPLQWAASAFMLSGSIPFFLYLRFLRGNRQAMFADQQVRGFLIFVGGTGALLAFWLHDRVDISIGEAITLSFFNVISIVTTTGYASTDYTAWGPGAVGVFLALMYVGGCSGSTSGGIKIYRYQVLYLIVRAHIKRLFAPNRVLALKYNGKILPDDVPFSILAFIAVYTGTIAVFTVCLALMGLDIVTAYSASVTAIANVGPGLGTIIGPVGYFGTLPDAAKWLLSFAMLAGRLEVLVLLIAFDRDFWRF